MVTDRNRDDAGRFEEEVTEHDILTAFDEADEPFLSATEVAETLGISRRAANYRLTRMHEEGLVGRKEIGARAVGWWAKVAPDPAESDGPEDEGTEPISRAEPKEQQGMDRYG